MTTDTHEPLESKEAIIVGGDIETPAFCLLAGVFTASDNTFDMISLPIAKLPATIGRSHETDEAHFFGLGTRKALSRQQAIIHYRDKFGGRLEEESEKLVFRKPEKRNKAVQAVLREDMTKDLPSQGFFVIECVGKNRIFVNQQRVDPGEVALLENGSRIRMNAYNLYFLLPTDATPQEPTISIPNQNNKKRKTPSFTPSMAASDQSSSEAKKHYSGGFGAVAKVLEETTADELMVEMDHAVRGNQWERRQQMIGSAVLLHSVRDAARSASLQKLAKENNGVSRSEIMDRIKLTDKYKKWVDQMLTKMEYKSYQANTSKALTKAGYTRTGTTGRHVKWILPDLGTSDEDIFATNAGGERAGNDNDDDRHDDDVDADESSSDENEAEKGADEDSEDDVEDQDEVNEDEEQDKVEGDDELNEEDDDGMEDNMETPSRDYESYE